MGLFNKVCEYLENEKGLKGGFYCTLTGKHISSSDKVFKEYVSSFSLSLHFPPAKMHPTRDDYYTRQRINRPEYR